MRSKLAWPILAVLAAVAGASIPLLFNPTFYFIDDSQSGALGQWYEIGRRVLEGDWSVINPTVWQAGHYLAEGAWGIFSPLLWVIGIGLHFVADGAIYMTVVKLCLFGIAAYGLWLLSRTFGVAAHWAAAIAVAASLTGFTLYMDAASWVNGFMAWALWPLAWALVRRAVFEAKSPLLAIVACASMMGIGYVHGTLALACTFVATIIEAIGRGHRATIIRAFAAATAAGLFAVVVHLPSLLVSPITGRTAGVANTGLMTVDLSGLAASAVPIAGPQMGFFGTTFPNAPLLYIAWFLPVLAFVEWRRFAGVLRDRISIVIVFGIALSATLLPSDFGPLRFPVRLMPYVAVAVIVMVGIGLSMALARPLTARRLWSGVALTFASTYFAFVVTPEPWKALAVVLAIALAGLLAVYAVLGGAFGRSAAESAPRRVRPVAAASVVAGVTLLMLVPQHMIAPSSPLQDYGSPALLADYRTQFPDAEGDVLVVGGVENGRGQPGYWLETLAGNMFYLNPASVQNSYSAVYYPPFQALTCMYYNGSTCGEAFTMIFAELPQTGLPVVDVLGVSTVQAIKAGVAESAWSVVPDGWHVVEDTALTRTIVRDDPIDPAGSVAWSSDGTEVTVLEEDAMGVTFRVDDVPASGGTVALSRIPWPGYRVDGATIAEEPVDTMLLGIDIPSDARGTTVTVSYWSPGWQLQVASGALLVLLLGGWTLLRRLPRGGETRLGTWAAGARAVVPASWRLGKARPPQAG